MHSSALSAGRPYATTVASVAPSAKPESGEALGSLLGAGQFLEAVIEHIPAVVFVKAARDFRFILLNRAGEEFLGVSRQAIIGKTDHDVFPKEEADQFVARDREVLKSRHVEIIEEEPVHTPHNGLRFLRTRMIVICDDKREPEYLLGISEDVTDQKRKTERIRHMAHHDGLTDLANRALFRQRTRRGHGRISRHAARRCVVLHRSRRLQAAERHAWPSDRRRRAAAVAERLRRARRRATPWLGSAAMSSRCCIRLRPASKSLPALAVSWYGRSRGPTTSSGSQLTLTASIGVSLAGEACQEPDRMLKNADVALYRAKTDGRNAFRLYDPSMDNHLEAKRDLERAVRNALARGEFEVHYQPIVDVRSERTCGFEALTRWRHRERGLLPPSEFIGIAEEVGFIIPLGEWVLRKACDDAADWPAYTRLAVNISPAQCTPALTQTVMNALAASRLPPDRLELEITDRRCYRTTAPRSPHCINCASSASRSPWTISAPAIPRCLICAASPSTRSRSTRASSAMSWRIRRACRSCAPWRASA